MSAMRFVPLGVGDAFSALHYSSCLALEADGTWVLIDCPHPIRKMLREAGVMLDVDGIAAVALTHLHADHSTGLEGLAFYTRFVVGRPATLLAHPAVSERLWKGHLAAGMEWATLEAGKPPLQRQLSDFFDLVPLSEDGPVAFGPFTVECRRTLHSIPTTAFLIRASGRCLGYSADTAFDPTLVQWLAAADLIVHECGPGLLHTPYEHLAALPAEVRGRMRLIHYPDNFDLRASVIEPLRQGQSYTV